LNQEGDKSEPRFERIATLWRLRGTRGRNIECAAFRTETGLESRHHVQPAGNHRNEVVSWSWALTNRSHKWPISGA